MVKRMFVLLLCFALVFAIGLGTIQAKKADKCDLSFVQLGMTELMKDVNSNTQYTDFIAASNYKAVKLLIDKTEEYYFVYDAETNNVKQVDNAQEDFTIKVTCRQINKIVAESRDKSSIKFNRLILNRIPTKVKSDVLNQCFETPWCLNKILGK